MSDFGNRNDGVGSSSWGPYPHVLRGCPRGEEENAATVRKLQEELSDVRKELVTLKVNMDTMVENRVTQLMQPIKDWIEGGRHGPPPEITLLEQYHKVDDADDFLREYDDIANNDQTSDPSLKKKWRKRGRKSDYINTRPRVVHDHVQRCSQPYHVAGSPILPPDKLNQQVGVLKNLHDLVLREEKILLQMPYPTYPVFVAKVPKGFGFVDKPPADVFFLRFDDIFAMFHFQRLHRSWVRLFALSEAYQLIQEREYTPKIAIIDPYYMIESNLESPDGMTTVTTYIQDFFVSNKEKDVLLLPYFLE